MLTALVRRESETTSYSTLAVHRCAVPVVKRLALTKNYFVPSLLSQRFGGDHQRVDRDKLPFVADERIRVTFGGANHDFRGDRVSLGCSRYSPNVEYRCGFEVTNTSLANGLTETERESSWLDGCAVRHVDSGMVASAIDALS